jgi:ABC-type siderophore export system fused ATPase/permease subunit
VVCVVGGNGSGKTVLIRLLTGLYPPAAGHLLYNGAPVGDGERQAYREQFSTVFTDFHLFSELLGRRDTQPSRVTAWLDYFGLAGKTGFAAGRFSSLALSTGQRKRLALAVAMLDERPILVLDEFGAEQDPERRHQFYRQWLAEFRRLGKTVIVVSHDDHYFDAADRLIRMDFGRVVEDRRLDAAASREPVAGGR